MARPPIYSDGMVAEAKAMAFVGATDREIAEFFGVAERTIHRWKIEHPEFGEALVTGKAPADRRVEHSLYRRATGYTFDSEKVFHHDGKIVRVPIVEHVPPDTTAGIFWMKNRDPENWRDRRDVSVSGNLSNMSETEIAVRAASLLASALEKSE